MLVLLQERSYKMAKIIVNLTLPLVNEKIEYVLYRHANYFYQRAFSLPDLRQELIIYVLSRFTNSYTAIDAGQELLITYGHELAEKQLQIETIIYQGIYDILPQSE